MYRMREPSNLHLYSYLLFTLRNTFVEIPKWLHSSICPLWGSNISVHRFAEKCTTPLSSSHCFTDLITLIKASSMFVSVVLSLSIQPRSCACFHFCPILIGHFPYQVSQSGNHKSTNRHTDLFTYQIFFIRRPLSFGSNPICPETQNCSHSIMLLGYFSLRNWVIYDEFVRR